MDQDKTLLAVAVVLEDFVQDFYKFLKVLIVLLLVLVVIQRQLMQLEMMELQVYFTLSQQVVVAEADLGIKQVVLV